MQEEALEQVTGSSVPGSAGTSAPGELLLRWEWRSFEYKPKLWQDAIQDAVKTMPVGLMAETYLLTRQSPNNVKVRDGKVEVKQLVNTEEHGLELWRPTAKYDFPLKAGQLGELCVAWGVPRRDDCADVPTPEDLLSFVTHCAPEVRIVPVRKWRRRFQLMGCVGERATLLVSGTLLESLCLEHHDPAVLAEALATLHLDRERNTNYVRAIKRVLGWSETGTSGSNGRTGDRGAP